MNQLMPYSDIVIFEEFLWSDCMARLPHALDCAAWINIIGPNDSILDDNTGDNLKPDDTVLGLEVDFWGQAESIRFYADEILRFQKNRDEYLAMFDGIATDYMARIENGQGIPWLHKSFQIPDQKHDQRPHRIQDWQKQQQQQ